MNTFRLNISGALGFDPVVSMDGKLVRVERDRVGNRFCTYSTQADTVRVAIGRYFETRVRGWFWLALLFFVLGLFGLIAPGYTRRCMSVDCQFDIGVAGNAAANVRFGPAQDGVRAAAIETARPVSEIANRFYFDRRAKRRASLLILVRIVLFVAAVITSIVLIVG